MISFQRSIQILRHGIQHMVKDGLVSGRYAPKQLRKEFLLQCLTLGNDRERLIGKCQSHLAPVAWNGTAGEIAIRHQSRDIHRYKICLELSDLYNVPGGVILRIVCQKQQNVQRGLGQVVRLTQRMTGKLICLIKLLGELKLGIIESSPF